MKKVLLIGLVLTMMITMLAGCSAAKEETQPEASQTQDQAAAEDDLYVEINGVKLYIGTKFEDVVDQLGEQTSPEQVILPCDGGDAYRDVTHFYGSCEVTENRDGLIKMITIWGGADSQVTGGALLMGEIKPGDSTEDLFKALGNPITFPIPDDMYAADYESADGMHVLTVFLDPDTNKETVSGWMLQLKDWE